MTCCGDMTLDEAMASLGTGQFKWQPISEPATKALVAVLARWEGTPYMSGQRARKIGVDCVQAIAAVLDELAGTVTLVPRLAIDSGAHSELPGLKIARLLMEAFGAGSIDDGTMEPGDIVVVRNELGSVQERLGHTLIVSDRPMVAWHAQWGAGFVPTTLMAVGDILKIYRPDKSKWGQSKVT